MAEQPSSDAASAWQPVHRTRTHEAVFEQIEAQILSGRLNAGDKLPSERELSEALQVSRASVREALRVLEALDIVAVRPGSGTESGSIIVHRPGDAITTLLRLQIALSLFTMDDIVEARTVLEKWTAAAASRNAGPEQLEIASGLVDSMKDQDLTASKFQQLDADFHVAVARASGNPLMFTFLQGLREALKLKLSERMEKMPNKKLVMQQLAEEHEQLLDAIRAGNAELASDLVVNHIREFYAQIVPTDPSK